MKTKGPKKPAKPILIKPHEVWAKMGYEGPWVGQDVKNPQVVAVKLATWALLGVPAVLCGSSNPGPILAQARQIATKLGDLDKLGPILARRLDQPIPAHPGVRCAMDPAVPDEVAAMCWPAIEAVRKAAKRAVKEKSLG
jgi:hypothetical protein